MAAFPTMSPPATLTRLTTFSWAPGIAICEIGVLKRCLQFWFDVQVLDENTP
jgi:hypothetical protein